MGKKVQDIMRDLEELSSKGLLSIERVRTIEVETTELGIKYLSDGLPEEKLLNRLLELKKVVSIKELKEIVNLSFNEFSAAIGILRKLGIVSIEEGKVKLMIDKADLLKTHSSRIKELLKRFKEPKIVNEDEIRNLRELRRRGLVEFKEVKYIRLKPTRKLLSLIEKGLIKEAKVITALTEKIITSGSWREALFKKFDLGVEIPTIHPKKRHPYIQFLNYVRYVISNMGFKEFKGPYVESELWNFEVLFVPQYHPSRRGTDVYFIRNEDLNIDIPEDIIARVKNIHERVLNYSWDITKALRPILRTHTTPVSMRAIYELGGGEYRVFSLDRVFRPDTPDPTHLMEFHQLEGIIVGKKVTFKHLLGFFKEFAKRLGLGDVIFKPAYFPFTEPSVEGYIKHPKLGWIEVFPGGMFRPEVLESVGLKGYKVAAWGIGIDRIAMIFLGIDDIRDLYTNDLDVIKRMKIPSKVFR